MKEIIRTKKGREFVNEVREKKKTTYEEINKCFSKDYTEEQINELVKIFLEEGIEVLSETETKAKGKTKTKAKTKTKSKAKAKEETKAELDKEKDLNEKEKVKIEEIEEIEQKDLFELKNVAQPVVARADIFFTETKMNEKKNTYETLETPPCINRTFP